MRIIKCIIQILVSLIAWAIWLGLSAIALILSIILDLFWTGFDKLVRPFSKSWNPLAWIIPEHEAFGVVKWIGGLSLDGAKWIIDYFYDC